MVQALDGGVIDEAGFTIAADGTAGVTFQAGAEPGLYRLLFNLRGKTAVVQFWVPDPENPAGNPAGLLTRNGEKGVR